MVRVTFLLLLLLPWVCSRVILLWVLLLLSLLPLRWVRVSLRPMLLMFVIRFLPRVVLRILYLLVLRLILLLILLMLLPICVLDLERRLWSNGIVPQ